MEGRVELLLGIWEAVKPYALASATGVLVALLFYCVVWG